ncbi:hypothetical protein B296_00001744 [Ensete ventricosum]|uniref:Uncharacterized protein n=1 Tax=Ensete ventricosum TaxID=4639 RepID=A0A427A373_ENSVE|nr:hypothetical protein B296_00001744 [Ensete ventricosum]
MSRSSLVLLPGWESHETRGEFFFSVRTSTTYLSPKASDIRHRMRGKKKKKKKKKKEDDGGITMEGGGLVPQSKPDVVRAVASSRFTPTGCPAVLVVDENLDDAASANKRLNNTCHRHHQVVIISSEVKFLAAAFVLTHGFPSFFYLPYL